MKICVRFIRRSEHRIVSEYRPESIDSALEEDRIKLLMLNAARDHSGHAYISTIGSSYAYTDPDSVTYNLYIP